MKKFLDWLDDSIPYVWGVLWIISISALSLGAAIWLVQWVMQLLGVL